MSERLRILFVGETWKGSSARSLREGLDMLDGALTDEIGEDHYLPRHGSRILRGINRMLRPWQVADLERMIAAKLDALQPDVLMVYKGSGVRAETVRHAKARGVFTVNVFPDYSPHAYGSSLRTALGEYDLVVSTKPFHPDGWASIYGYRNRCVFVPHGYDPDVHLWREPAGVQDYDVVVASTWRPEYHQLMKDFARELGESPLRVGLAGNGWEERRNEFPAGWEYAGPLFGRAYGEWLRRGKIAIASVHTQVCINGVQQPGDEDTTRTYELAAAHCFFLHRRTPYVQTVYDEQTEVPMWETPRELAQLVRRFLPLEQERRSMAAAAHARAVPAYCIPNRVAQVFDHVRKALRAHLHARS